MIRTDDYVWIGSQIVKVGGRIRRRINGPHRHTPEGPVAESLMRELGAGLRPMTMDGWYEHDCGAVSLFRWDHGQIQHLTTVSSWAETDIPIDTY